MPYGVDTEGCFMIDSYSFDCLGDAKEAYKYLNEYYSQFVGHCAYEPKWWEWTGWGGPPRIYVTFEEFKKEFEEQHVFTNKTTRTTTQS